jgi:hypothetical protein
MDGNLVETQKKQKEKDATCPSRERDSRLPHARDQRAGW